MLFMKKQKQRDTIFLDQDYPQIYYVVSQRRIQHFSQLGFGIVNMLITSGQ